jgi:hypothetical protein
LKERKNGSQNCIREEKKTGDKGSEREERTRDKLVEGEKINRIPVYFN